MSRLSLNRDLQTDSSIVLKQSVECEVGMFRA